MITEKNIEAAADKFDRSEKAFEQAALSFEQKQPVLHAYLLSEHFDLFTEEEKDYAHYLLMVAWQAILDAGLQAAQVDEGRLANAEEHNWALFQQGPDAPFRRKLDIFYEKTKEEDLLAFLEDAFTEEVEDDDELPFTREGRDALFITVKSMVDSLLEGM
ncbi:MAG TPA: hypothetical protein PKA00_06395 [Saprospiraceae bacterium]|nr:hypothetical protein [Saprospiraceae bacterium]HMQ82515.1 hypothetical protein [Saprospiraceae bacterium]